MEDLTDVNTEGRGTDGVNRVWKESEGEGTGTVDVDAVLSWEEETEIEDIDNGDDDDGGFKADEFWTTEEDDLQIIGWLFELILLIVVLIGADNGDTGVEFFKQVRDDGEIEAVVIWEGEAEWNAVWETDGVNWDDEVLGLVDFLLIGVFLNEVIIERGYILMIGGSLIWGGETGSIGVILMICSEGNGRSMIFSDNCCWSWPLLLYDEERDSLEMNRCDGTDRTCCSENKDNETVGDDMRKQQRETTNRRENKMNTLCLTHLSIWINPNFRCLARIQSIAQWDSGAKQIWDPLRSSDSSHMA